MKTITTPDGNPFDVAGCVVGKDGIGGDGLHQLLSSTGLELKTGAGRGIRFWVVVWFEWRRTRKTRHHEKRFILFQRSGVFYCEDIDWQRQIQVSISL
jgi:hypothetical protein